MKRKPITPELRRAVYEKGNGLCHICGQPLDPFECHVDHVIPLTGGGADDFENMMPAHKNCNSRKGGARPYSRQEQLTFAPQHPTVPSRPMTPAEEANASLNDLLEQVRIGHITLQEADLFQRGIYAFGKTNFLNWMAALMKYFDERPLEPTP